jgi:hypothetical protein
MCNATQKLQQKVLDLGRCEARIHVVDQVRHIVLKRVEDED